MTKKWAKFVCESDGYHFHLISPSHLYKTSFWIQGIGVSIQVSVKSPGNVKINNACQIRETNIMDPGVNIFALFLALVQYFSSLSIVIFFLQETIFIPLFYGDVSS